MNTFSKNEDHFYPFFRFSANSRKGADWTEKETFGHFQKPILKVVTINARFLLKSYQPIHRHINMGNTNFKIISLKNKKWNIDNWRVDNSAAIFQEKDSSCRQSNKNA